jgi:hypothetical protein
MRKRWEKAVGIAVLTCCLLMVGLVSGCDEDSPAGTTDNRIENTLVFSREGGSSLAMGDDYAVCCGVWEEGSETAALKIFVFSLADLGSQVNEAPTFWKLFLVPAEITLGVPLDLPTESGEHSKMFVVDGMNGNELSSDTPGSSGTITLTRLECGPPVRVAVILENVVLESELGGMGPVQVSGTFEATVYENPAFFDCDFAI